LGDGVIGRIPAGPTFLVVCEDSSASARFLAGGRAGLRACEPVSVITHTPYWPGVTSTLRLA
jgi:hypothetical protein